MLSLSAKAAQDCLLIFDFFALPQYYFLDNDRGGLVNRNVIPWRLHRASHLRRLPSGLSEHKYNSSATTKRVVFQRNSSATTERLIQRKYKSSATTELVISQHNSSATTERYIQPKYKSSAPTERVISR